MAVFDEAPECLHPLPQYPGGHGYRFVTVQFCAAKARSCKKSGSDDRLENSIYILFLHKPIHISTTNHGPESLPCRGTSTRWLTNMEWIWYYMGTTTTTTT